MPVYTLRCRRSLSLPGDDVLFKKNGQTLQGCDLLVALGDKNVDSRRHHDHVLALLGMANAGAVLTSHQKCPYLMLLLYLI